MSILINLLPDIRQAKLRERRHRQMAIGISVVIWIICGGVVVLLSVYAAGQAVIIRSVSSSINSRESQLEAVPNLTTALTAEQHLASLPSLYQQRVLMSKFFDVYDASSPTGVTVGSLTIDADNNLTVDGTGTSYNDVATLATALADYNVSFGTGAAASNSPFFSNVTITNVGAVPGGVSFTIQAVMSTEVDSGSSQ